MKRVFTWLAQRDTGFMTGGLLLLSLLAAPAAADPATCPGIRSTAPYIAERANADTGTCTTHTGFSGIPSEGFFVTFGLSSGNPHVTMQAASNTQTISSPSISCSGSAITQGSSTVGSAWFTYPMAPGTRTCSLSYQHGSETVSASFNVVIWDTTTFDRTLGGFTVNTGPFAPPPDTTAPYLTGIYRHNPTTFKTNGNFVTWNAQFSEDVANVDASDFTVTNAPAGSSLAVTGSGSSYFLTLSGGTEIETYDGGVQIGKSPSNNIADLAGNALGIAPPGTPVMFQHYAFDNTPPTFTLSSTAPNPVTGSFDVIIDMSEEIAFSSTTTTNVLSITNGTRGDWQRDFSAFPPRYIATIHPTADGLVSVQVPVGQVSDQAGNANTAASNTITRTYTSDTTAPTVSITSTAPNPTNSGPIPVSVTFSEAVNGFTSNDLTISGGTVSNFSGSDGDASYSFDLTPSADGALTVDINAAVAADAAGNDNEAATQFSITYDSDAPGASAVSIASDNTPSTGATVGDTITLSLTFDEAVVAPTVTIQGEAANVSGSGTSYNASLVVGTATPTGNVSFSVSGIEDTAGNTAPNITSTTDSSTVTITTAPGFSMAFSPGTIELGRTGTLTYTIDNGASPLAATNLDFTHIFPTGIIVSYTSNLGTTCTGGTLTATGGGGVVRYTGGTVAAGASCTVSVDYRAEQLGTKASTTEELTSSLGTSGTASDTLTITQPDPLVFSASFTPDSIAQGQTTTLTFDIENGSALLAYDIAFTNTLPAGLVIADQPNVTNTCFGGTVTAPAGGGTVSYAGGQLTPVPGTCSISVAVKATGSGSLVNTSGDLTSSLGNSGTATDTLSVSADTTAPVLTLDGVPDRFDPGDVFALSFTFTEEVQSFDATDIVVTGGALSGFGGGPTAFTATLTPDGTQNVTVSVAEGAAEDIAGNPSNAVSASATLNSADIAGQMIADFMQNRARNLIANQPGLTGLLSGQQSGGNFNAQVTRGVMDLDTQARSGPLWFSLRGSATDYDNGGENVYALGVAGGHIEINSGLIFGGMLQFDYSKDNLGSGVETRGTGWMAGPYVVAQMGAQPVFFEGRLLYGQTDNKISPFGTFTDSFESERWLAMVAVSGSYEAEHMRIFPRLQFSHSSDKQLAYIDSLSNVVPEQTIRLSELSVGADFETPLFGDTSGHMLTFGASAIWSRVSGDGAATAFITDSEGGRGRFDLGYRHTGQSGLTVSGDLFVDGIGSGDFTTYGVEVGLSFDF